jgi:hypothetical protein
MYVAVWHRNHLGILSGYHLVNNGNNLFSYDFTSDSSQVYGGTQGCKEIAPGIWGMAAGDANGDGEITIQDKLLWEAETGTMGYKPSDFDMNEHVDNKDKNNFFIHNVNMNSFIPD